MEELTDDDLEEEDETEPVQLQSTTYWMFFTEETGMLPVWFNGTEYIGTFAIGD